MQHTLVKLHHTPIFHLSPNLRHDDVVVSITVLQLPAVLRTFETEVGSGLEGMSQDSPQEVYSVVEGWVRVD